MNKIRAKKADKNTTSDSKTYNVYGMTCGGCSSRLQGLFLKNENVENAIVSHDDNTVEIFGSISEDDVKTIVVNAGFSLEE